MSGHLGLGGGPSVGGSVLYPALIAPAWLAQKMSVVFDLAKAINALLVSLTAAPVYFWARRIVSPAWALVASGLVLLMTGLVLSGMLMSENAALPIFTGALFAIGVTVEEPTLPRQLLVLVLLPLAYATRAQGLVLLAILPSALILDAVLERRVRVSRGDVSGRLRRLAPMALVLVIALLAYLARSGFSPGHALGFYHRVATTHYSPSAVALWTARHGGEAALALAVAPMCALLLLVLTGLIRGLERRSERAFVATAAAAVFWFLLQTGMYASAFSPTIIERYSMYAFPPLVIAFVVWLGQDLRRPRLETTVASACTLALSGFIIFSRFVEPEGPFATGVFARLTVHFFTRLPQHVPGGLVVARIVLAVCALLLVFAFAFAPPRIARVVLPAASAILLLFASHSAYGLLSANTRGWATVTGPTRSWIDDQIGTSSALADYLYVPDPSVDASSKVLVNTQFWNRSVGTAYTLGAPQLCPLPLETLRLDERTGALLDPKGHPPKARYLITSGELAIAGRFVAAGGPIVNPLKIVRPAQPLKLATRVLGVYPDGWTGADASYFRYWSARRSTGVLAVTLSRAAWTGPDAPGKVKVMVRSLGAHSGGSRTAVGTWIAHAGESKVVRLRAPAPPFEISIHVAPTFSPAQFGSNDTRRLGVQFSVSSAT